MYLCYKQSCKESYCSLVCKLYLPCFFSVVDLCVSGISARCNQATVAFLRLLIFVLFFSITEVASNREKILFFKLLFSSPHASLVVESQSLLGMATVEKDEAGNNRQLSHELGQT